MPEFWAHLASVFMGFFAIMNPIANTPVFLGLTAGDEAAVRRRVAFQAVLWAFLIVLTFCVLGRMIFDLFGITLPAFKLTGGLLVTWIGFEMLQGRPSGVHHPSQEDQADSMDNALSVALSPLAIPVLAGPGTIATAMNFGATGSTSDLVVTIGAFASLCFVTLLAFLSGEKLVGVLGQNGMNVVTRLMGLILAVIGVQMVIDGIQGAFGLSVPPVAG